MRLPARPRSIRLRLAMLLTALFVLLGMVLLGVSYALVRSNLKVHPRPSGAAPERTTHAGEAGHRRLVAEVNVVQQEFADDALQKLTTQYLAIMGAMTLLSGALGWFVSGRLVRPLNEITSAARRVSDERLHERIALDGADDELKQLADTFDAMLDRLEAGFERQAAFVRNASHELRTPLSVIRAEADVSLADEIDQPEALRRSLAVVREAGQRSERLIEALLTLAQADRDDRPFSRVELSELVRRVTNDVDLDGVRLTASLDPAPVDGDRELLRTMAANVVDNAVQHNSPGGWVEIRTGVAGDEAQLEVSNSGPTITAEEAASLTEPFRRLGLVRTGDGVGLGLSIAAAVARAHRGELEIEPLERGGVRVSIRLPATAEGLAR